MLDNIIPFKKENQIKIKVKNEEKQVIKIWKIVFHFLNI